MSPRLVWSEGLRRLVPVDDEPAPVAPPVAPEPEPPARTSVLGPPVSGPLAEVAWAQAKLARIQRQHAAATDQRALAVYRARRAGVSLTALGRILGTARTNVPALERRGAQIAAGLGETLPSDALPG